MCRSGWRMLRGGLMGQRELVAQGRKRVQSGLGTEDIIPRLQGAVAIPLVWSRTNRNLDRLDSVE